MPTCGSAASLALMARRQLSTSRAASLMLRTAVDNSRRMEPLAPPVFLELQRQERWQREPRVGIVLMLLWACRHGRHTSGCQRMATDPLELPQSWHLAHAIKQHYCITQHYCLTGRMCLHRGMQSAAGHQAAARCWGCRAGRRPEWEGCPGPPPLTHR